MANEIIGRLENEKVSRLLLQYAIPAVIGTMVNALYNIVDRVFIGQGVGALAIAGLTLTFPILLFLQAFGMLVGAGAATRVSIHLGRKANEMAEKVLGNAFTLTFIITIITVVPCMIWMEDLLLAFGGSEQTIPYAKDYLNIVVPGTILTSLSFGFNAVMRASGYPKKAMLSSMLSVGCNLVLAPIFIFVFDWGIRGAAFATLLSQSVALVWVLHHFLDKKTYIRFHRSTLKLRKRIVKQIFSIGMSPFIMNVCACCIVIFINYQLLSHGDDYSVGAFGIINRVQMLFVMIVMGIAQGMQPITGYNFGAGLVDRARRSVQLGIAAGCTMTTLGFVLAVFFPGMLVGMFTDSALLVEQASKALSISMLSFPVVGAQIIICQFFQSIGKAFIAIFLSLSRQLLFLLPGLALLPVWMGVDGVWTSMPVSDFLATVAAVVMFVYQIRKFRRKAAVTTI